MSTTPETDHGLIWILVGILVLAGMSGAIKHEPTPTPNNRYPFVVQNMIDHRDRGAINSFEYNNRRYYEIATNRATGSGTTIYNELGEKTGNCNPSLGPNYYYEICDSDYRNNFENIYTNW